MAELYVTVKAMKIEGKDRLKEIWEVGSTGKEADYVSLLGNKVAQIRCFKQQNVIISEFWRLEVQNRGGVGFFWGPSPWLVNNCLHVHMACSL